MKSWILFLIIWALAATLMQTPRFWKDRGGTRGVSRYFGILLTSFFFSLSLFCWTASIRYWTRAEESDREREERSSADLEPWDWEQTHSTRPATYPSTASPTDILNAPAETQDYERKLQPGYAPKF